ncbi:MAG: right-handed parallel beta-helix repeat-containing protein, partial [Anaerolineae bacterium]|nr:right-handed parallel beta-helix repeat-containing protein [Anaerolineae bacterium]
MKRSLLAPIISLLGMMIVFSVWLALAQPPPPPIVVDSFADGPGTCPGPGCTLRQALLTAGSGDTITFSGPGTIFVNQVGGLGPLPVLGGGVTISAGVNQIILDGGSSLSTDPPLPYALLIDSDDNVIQGLQIQNFEDDAIVIANGNGNLIGGTGPGQGNVILLNGGDGIVLDASGTQPSGNTIQGNLIGTEMTGSSVQANAGVGVRLINGSDYNLIGGTTSTATNIISGNSGGGIVIDGSSNNLVQGNRIGLDGASGGVIGLGNGTTPADSGVHITNGSDDNEINDNAIAASSGDGIAAVDSAGTLIIDNRIGLDAAFGLLGIANGGYGLRLDNATGSSVSANAIAANDLGGVFITGGSTNNTVSTNLIGLAANGTTAIPNSGSGIVVGNAASNLIDDNTIAANIGDGVVIDGGTLNTISNNRIGLNQSLAASGNGGSGVSIVNAAAGTAITDNTIANNGAAGVSASGGTGTTITGNTMFSNTGLGIDLGGDGVTLNDPGDPDIGPNGLQNFPVIASALFDGIVTTLSGNLNSTPNTDFTLEFFSNGTCDPSDYGEAETVLAASVGVTSNAAGNILFTTDLSGLAVGEFVTVTATNDTTGATSEFGLCEVVDYAEPVASFNASPLSGTAPLAVSFSDTSTGVIDTYFWDFDDGSTSTQQNPSYSFTQPGLYFVTLTVTGPGGSDSFTRLITVTAPGSNPPPTQTPTAQVVVAPSGTPTGSVTPTTAATLTATVTASASPTVTLTTTPSPTRTATATQTRTFTPTWT